VDAEVFSFGQELADESVGVFIDAALPGRVRVGEVDLDPGVGGESLVLGHLLAAIIGDAESLLGFNSIQHAGKALDGGLGAGAVHLGQQGKQRGALDQGADGGAVVLALAGIALPVSGDEAFFDFGGALGDRNYVGDPPPGNTVIWRGLSRLTDIELGIMIGVQLVGN